MKICVNLMLVLFLVGCGYKPIAKLTQDMLGDFVYVDVIMSKVDPQNTVAIKDSISQGVIQKLHKTIATKDNSDSAIIASISSLDFVPVLYDDYGFVTAYKANLTMSYKVKLKDGTIKNFNTTGEYDFSVTNSLKNERYTNTIISDKDRYEAIKNASEEAFDDFISKLAIWGI